jgi:hypothetical protein
MFAADIAGSPGFLLSFPNSIFPYNKMPDVDLANRHPALQSMCSKD